MATADAARMPIISHAPGTVSAPMGGYSHGVEVPAGTRLLFVSGQIPERPDGTVPDGFEAQCEAAWRNVLAVLAAAGDARPALTVMIARTLQPEWLLEIEAVAAAGSPPS